MAEKVSLFFPVSFVGWGLKSWQWRWNGSAYIYPTNLGPCLEKSSSWLCSDPILIKRKNMLTIPYGLRNRGSAETDSIYRSRRFWRSGTSPSCVVVACITTLLTDPPTRGLQSSISRRGEGNYSTSLSFTVLLISRLLCTPTVSQITKLRTGYKIHWWHASNYIHGWSSWLLCPVFVIARDYNYYILGVSTHYRIFCRFPLSFISSSFPTNEEVQSKK